MFDPVSALLMGGMSLIGGSMTNSANRDNTMQAQMFNSAESQLNRDFNANQGVINRQFSSDESKIARDFNAAEAEKSRQFTQAQSSTAYQRAVADMKKAGINPMLAYMKGGADTGGAATASGPAASGSAASGSAASSPGFQPAVNSIQQALSSAKEWQYVEPQIDKIKQDVAIGKEEERQRFVSANKTNAEIEVVHQQKKNMALDEKLKKEQLSQAEKAATVADIDQDHYSTWYGKLARNIGNIGKDINPFVSSAKNLNQMYNGD